jgi:hypothetical protein
MAVERRRHESKARGETGRRKKSTALRWPRSPFTYEWVTLVVLVAFGAGGGEGQEGFVPLSGLHRALLVDEAHLATVAMATRSLLCTLTMALAHIGSRAHAGAFKRGETG